MAAGCRTLTRLGDGLIDMRRRRSKTPSTDDAVSANDLFLAPIITDHLVIRGALRSDATDLESTMPSVAADETQHTADGARQFGAGLHELPVWTGTRVVALKGSVRIVGGLVITDEEAEESTEYRIGWWLGSGAEQHAVELMRGVEQRLRELGADRVVMHVRADDDAALDAAERSGFLRGEALQHSTTAGRLLDFWEYASGG